MLSETFIKDYYRIKIIEFQGWYYIQEVNESKYFYGMDLRRYTPKSKNRKGFRTKKEILRFIDVNIDRVYYVITRNKSALDELVIETTYKFVLVASKRMRYVWFDKANMIYYDNKWNKYKVSKQGLNDIPKDLFYPNKQIAVLSFEEQLKKGLTVLTKPKLRKTVINPERFVVLKDGSVHNE